MARSPMAVVEESSCTWGIAGALSVVESIADIRAGEALVFVGAGAFATCGMALVAVIAGAVKANVAETVSAVIKGVGVAGPTDAINFEESCLASTLFPIPSFIIATSSALVINQVFFI